MHNSFPNLLLINSPKKQLLSILTIATLLLFFCSSLRHALFRSTGFDLGIFDQAIYLISQGFPAIPTIRFDYHIVADHAAFVFYPLAVLYWIFPDVHWLFLTQAISLASAILPLYKIARQAGLGHLRAICLCWVYLLYPVVFNVNLFDFHPEVIAIPLLLTAVYAARTKKIVLFVSCLIGILLCKVVLALTVAALGLWLIFFENRRLYGLVASIAGLTYFLIGTQFIIPNFTGLEHISLYRYSYLGDSIPQILINLLLEPERWFMQVFRFETLTYLLLLFIPIAWGLAPTYSAPLLVTIPTLLLNILSQEETQRDLGNQYQLPMLPFFMVTLIDAMQARRTWLKARTIIIAWAIIGFIGLSRWWYFLPNRYFMTLDNWSALRSAVSIVSPTGGVLTDNYLAPHFTHRVLINTLDLVSAETDLNPYKYVVLNLRHPWPPSQKRVNDLAERMLQEASFKAILNRDDVVVYARIKGLDND